MSDRGRALRLSAALVGVGSIVCGGVAAAAPAKAHPEAMLVFANHSVTAGQSAALGYATSRVPGGSVITIQRQFGSANVWRKVAAAPAASGSVTVPGVAMGVYHYRVHVVRGKTLVVNSAAATLYSYGTIPLQNLCDDDAVQVSCSEGTAQVGTTVLPYVLYDGGTSNPPQYDLVLKAQSSSCRAIAMRWGIDNASGDAGSADTATLTVVRSDADPQSGTIGYGYVGTLSARLDRGAWDLDLSATGTDDFGDAVDNVAVNGTLSCYTTSGTR